MHNIIYSTTKRIPFIGSGILHEISEEILITRPEKGDLRKILVTIETTDGQLFFGEVRNTRIESLRIKKFSPKDKVKFEFVFQGSEKNGKKHNNIYISKIEKL